MEALKFLESIIFLSSIVLITMKDKKALKGKQKMAPVSEESDSDNPKKRYNSSESEEDTVRKYHSSSDSEDDLPSPKSPRNSNIKQSQSSVSISSMDSVFGSLKLEESERDTSSDEDGIMKHDTFDILLRELMDRQLPNIPAQWKLSVNDMKRICGYIKTSIFSKSKCSIWNGYITNKDQANKGTYVNFFFNGKKVALHRLLHINYVYPLDDTWYLKFKCKNKGKCCNINHCEKFKYSKVNKKKKVVVKKNTMKIGSSTSVSLGLNSDSE